MTDLYANATEFAGPITLTSSIDADDTFVAVSATAPASLRGGTSMWRIGDELVRMTIGAGGTSPWTAERGMEGSTAAVHAAGSRLRHYLTAGQFRSVESDQAALAARKRVLGDYSTLTAGVSVLRGELVTRTGALYERISDGSIEASFDATKWTAVTGATGPPGTVTAFSGDLDGATSGAGLILRSRGGGAYRLRLYVDENGVLATESLPAPAEPSGLTATTAGAAQINLTWVDNSTDETSFEIQRSLSSAFTSPTTLTAAANATSKSDTGLGHETTYYYRARALNGGQASGWSGTASATTTASPADATGLIAWYDPSVLSGLSEAAAIATLPNLQAAGAARDAVQATSSKQPTYRTNVSNGLAVARFDGIDDFLQSAAFTSVAQPRTVYIAARMRGAVGVRTMFDGIGSTARSSCNIDATDHLACYAGTVLTGPATTPQSWHVYAVRFSGAGTELRVDDGAATTGQGGSNGLTGATLGAAYNGTTQFGDVDLGEVFVIAASYDAKYVNYLKTKWAIA